MSTAADSIRYHMLKVVNNRNNKYPSGKTGHRNTAANLYSQPQSSSFEDSKDFNSLEAKAIIGFHAAATLSNQLNIFKYIMSEIPACQSAVLLRIFDEGQTVRLYCRDSYPCEHPETYRVADYWCIQEVVSAKTPLIHENRGNKSSTLGQWKTFFGRSTEVVAGIPIVTVTGVVEGILALSFKTKVPKGFLEKKLPAMQEVLDVLVPYALLAQTRNDHEEHISLYNLVIQSLEKVDKVVAEHSVNIALTQISSQIAALGKSKNWTMFIVDENDRIMRKFNTTPTHQGKATCPEKAVHTMMEIPFSQHGNEILDYVAVNKKGIKLSQPSDLTEYGIQTKVLHSVGNCVTKSIIAVPVTDFSGESSIVVEITEKDRVFLGQELEAILVFCQHAACLLTCAILIDRRERNFRRRNIINEMLCSISYVKRDNVEQFIVHHRRTSNVFRGNFMEYTLCVRCIPEVDIAGLALEAFYDMNVMQDFQIRRSVLVRFIMSVQQGYGALPYHNWYHAVSVAHFAYLLIKKLNLIELGHLTKLEAFALVVSALTHDIDHRGTNNQFQSYTNSDIFKLYACEESVMERHHLGIALAVLHREDCNILESFNDANYKYFVELLTWNIIATDISKHLKNREALFAEARSGNPKQRKMARLSLFMTAADLCDNAKKWDENLPTVKGILTEFFNQGDMERQLGFTPIPMMDRQVADIPLIEFKFVKYIVCPVYRYLAEIYDALVPCLQNILRLEDLWALAVHVFDAKKDTMDLLDILDLPDMKEEALMKYYRKGLIEEIKSSRFAQPAPPPPPPQPSQTTTTSGGGATEKKPAEEKKSITERRDSENTNNSYPLDMEEVDTGEKRKCKCKCKYCFKCCRKNRDQYQY